MSIRVVIADDHPVLLAGMEHMLGPVEDIHIVGLAEDSTAMVDLLGSQQVDVVVADFSMPQGRYGDGIALLRFVERRFPSVRRIVLTGVENPWVLRSILDIGVAVLVSKSDPHLQMEHAIRCAVAGHRFLSPGIERLLDAPVQGQLTKRESEVLRMYAEGLSLVEIGERVGRSRKTISTQKMSAMRKLGLSRDGEIFRYAISSGLVQASQLSRSNAEDDDA